jgi:hypothetical protein
MDHFIRSLGPLRLEKEGYSYLQRLVRDHIDTSGSNTERV